MSFFHYHEHYWRETTPAHPPAPPPPAAKEWEFMRNPTVRIFTKAEMNYSLTIRDGNVILAPQNPRDEYQHWYKDFRWSSKMKDKEDHPAFTLTNKANGLAIKHASGKTKRVALIPFNPDCLDESILWTESNNTGEGFHSIRMVNNNALILDAFRGDNDGGGVYDGTNIVLWDWVNGENQRWKIVPYY